MSIRRKATPRRARSIVKVNLAAPAPQINTSVEDPSGTGLPIVLRHASPVCILRRVHKGRYLRGTPENRPMRDASKPANGIEAGQKHLYPTADTSGFFKTSSR